MIVNQVGEVNLYCSMYIFRTLGMLSIVLTGPPLKCYKMKNTTVSQAVLNTTYQNCVPKLLYLDYDIANVVLQSFICLLLIKKTIIFDTAHKSEILGG